MTGFKIDLATMATLWVVVMGPCTYPLPLLNLDSFLLDRRRTTSGAGGFSDPSMLAVDIDLGDCRITGRRPQEGRPLVGIGRVILDIIVVLYFDGMDRSGGRRCDRTCGRHL